MTLALKRLPATMRARSRLVIEAVVIRNGGGRAARALCCRVSQYTITALVGNRRNGLSLNYDYANLYRGDISHTDNCRWREIRIW
jgi:hypothetical protein